MAATDRLQRHFLSGVKPSGRDIGIGAYAKVFEVEFCGGLYAAKEIHTALTESMKQRGFEKIKEIFIAECLQNCMLGHENLIRVLGMYDSGGNAVLPVLVMEQMEENLTSLVGNYPNMPDKLKFSILHDVCRGLWYLHSHHPPIVHCNLTPNNVLLSSQHVAKISDIGMTKVMQTNKRIHAMMRPQGSLDFTVPEALQETPQDNPPLDVFSYGAVILYVVNQEWPRPLHYIDTDSKTGRLIALSEIERRQQHIKKLAETSADLQFLVKQCLDNQPTKRPQIAAVAEKINKMKETEAMVSPHIHMNTSTWQGATITGSFPVNIKELDYDGDYVLNVDPKWNVSQVKEAISALYHKQITLVFSGMELKDDMILEDVGIQNTTTIHCLRKDHVQQFSANNMLLNKVNLFFTDHAAESQKACFYVFCNKPCAGVVPGKLRVQCSECKSRSFVLLKAPSGWDDVLTPNCMHGRCSDCGGDTAKFYFKCANHKTDDDDELPIPLHMFCVNDIKVECITCFEVKDVILVFGCDVNHSMCMQCFTDYAKDALNNHRYTLHDQYGYTIKCPAGCDGSEVKETEHFRILGPKKL